MRRPAVAGSFYPADGAALRAVVETELERARASIGRSGVDPKAIVAPHAGYVYSGPVAASAYARLLPRRGTVTRVVLLGPAHWATGSGITASRADAFGTPLGRVPVDTVLRDELVAAGLVVIDDGPHIAEHSLEVHLPFVQLALGEVRVLPLLAGDVPAPRLAAVIDAAWGGEETVVVVSTDLSHYHDHRQAERLDRRTAAAVLEKQPEALGPGDACGVVPLRGLLVAARARDLDVELLDLRTSADTAGSPESVVGYGAFAVGTRSKAGPAPDGPS